MFESCTPYESERIRAAAIYCSDGRLGENGLKMDGSVRFEAVQS
jgi:hypothetical protein